MFCSNCGTQNPNGVKFCNGCGAPMPAVSSANSDAQQGYQQNYQQNYTQQGYQQNYGQENYQQGGFQTPPPPPKKRSPLLIVGIVLGALLLLIIILVLVFALGSDSSKDSDEAINSKTTTETQDNLDDAIDAYIRAIIERDESILTPYLFPYRIECIEADIDMELFMQPETIGIDSSGGQSLDDLWDSFIEYRSDEDSWGAIPDFDEKLYGLTAAKESYGYKIANPLIISEIISSLEDGTYSKKFGYMDGGYEPTEEERREAIELFNGFIDELNSVLEENGESRKITDVAAVFLFETYDGEIIDDDPFIEGPIFVKFDGKWQLLCHDF